MIRFVDALLIDAGGVVRTQVDPRTAGAEGLGPVQAAAMLARAHREGRLRRASDGVEAVRRAGRVLDAILQDARTEPEAAEVDELAAVLHQQTACGCAGGVLDSDRDAARAALQWMRGRRWQGGTP